MTSRIEKNRRKIYRIGLFGWKGSGKTGTLIALAVARVMGALGYTATWVENPQSLPGFKDRTNPKGSLGTLYATGTNYINEQKNRIIIGSVPDATPPAPEPILLLYDFNTAERGDFQIQLRDYAGELIDPSVSDDDLKTGLAEHLRTMDAILVLAPVDAPADELHRLTQAFSVLRDMGCPVALLINKWDKHGPINYDSPEKEDAKLDAFLASNEGALHSTLLATIRNSVGKDNCERFPVSALGECERVPDTSSRLTGPANDPTAPSLPTIERPLDRQTLRSFKLEDGFVWAANRRDELDAERFQRDAARVSNWLPWDQLGKRGSWALGAAGREWLARHRPSSPASESDTALALHASLRRVNSAAIRQFAVTLFLAVIALIAVEFVLDNRRLALIALDIENHGTTSETLDQHTLWLEKYCTAPGYEHLGSRWLADGRDKAKKDLDQIRLHTDESYHAEDQNFVDKQTTLANAALTGQRLDSDALRKVLKQLEETPLPHPQFAGEFAAIQKSSQDKLTNQIALNTQREWEAKEASCLVQIDSWDQRLKANKTYAEFDVLKKDLKLPYLSPQSDKVLAAYKDLQHDRDREEIRRHRDVARALYRKHMDAGDIVPSANIVVDCSADAELTTELRKDFSATLVPLIQQKVNECLSSTTEQSFDVAESYVAQANEAQKILNCLDPDSIRELATIDPLINDKKDRYYYERVRKSKTVAEINSYLAMFPHGKMAGQVADYKAYLTAMSDKLNLTLVFTRIDWLDSTDNVTTEAKVTLNADPNPAIDKQNLVSANKSATNEEIGRTRFTAKLNDPITLKITMPGSKYIKPWKTYELGDATYNGTVKSLIGAAITLQNEDGGSIANFTIEGIPAEPTLPAWPEN